MIPFSFWKVNSVVPSFCCHFLSTSFSLTMAKGLAGGWCVVVLIFVYFHCTAEIDQCLFTCSHQLLSTFACEHQSLMKTSLFPRASPPPVFSHSQGFPASSFFSFPGLPRLQFFLIPRASPPPVFYCLQCAKTE